MDLDYSRYYKNRIHCFEKFTTSVSSPETKFDIALGETDSSMARASDGLVGILLAAEN